MSLAAGTRLGAYEVLALIGAGGMGEVYRARDARLNRDVAIKILPSHVAGDPDLRQRFEREARTLATLSHPHICSVFDVGQQDGVSFLVMEYLEGETLAERLASGSGLHASGKALPIDQAVTIAIQIASALDRAHRAGITHRDLKPSNIMLTKGGAKLLDFGLAKLHPTGMASGLSVAATMSSPITSHGTIVGTMPYMAPEQLEGKDSDARTDIFAFGAVVYEMLTGRRAFEGKSQASLISAIMSGEPAPISTLQPLAPDALDRIVRTCLAKDPDDRWQTAGDVGRQLKWIADGRSAVGGLAPAVVRRRHTRTVAAAAAASVVAALVAGLAVWVATRPMPSEPQRLSVVTPADHPVAFSWIPGRSLAISPDGTAVAYVARNPAAPPGGLPNHLEVRSVADRAPRVLPKTEGAVQPFFSPDGRWVAFFTQGATHELKKVSLAGGNPVTLLEKIDGGQWGVGTWTDEGAIIFGTVKGGLQRISSDSGPVQKATSLDAGEHSHRGAELVAGTRSVLFYVNFDEPRDSRIEAVMLDTGKRRVVVENGFNPHYLNSGYLLFQRGDAILAAPFDPKRLTITGSAVPLAEEVRYDGAASEGGTAQLAISRNGTLAYVPAADANQTMGRVGRDGVFEPIGSAPSRFGIPRISPTGRHIAFEDWGGPAEIEVHVRDLERGSTTKLTKEGSDRWPAWNPDGTGIAVFSQRPHAVGIYFKDLRGSERLLWPGDAGGAELQPSSWSPNGKDLAYTVQVSSSRDIWILTMDGKPAARPFLNTPAVEHSAKFSPDGRWLAYISDESGRSEVYIRRYPDGDKLPVSTDGGMAPVWSTNGSEIFFQGDFEGAPRLMTVSLTPDRETVRLGTPRPLLDMRVPMPSGIIQQYARSTVWGPSYDIFPDGKFLMVRGADQQSTREIVLVQNWFEELKRSAR